MISSCYRWCMAIDMPPQSTSPLMTTFIICRVVQYYAVKSRNAIFTAAHHDSMLNPERDTEKKISIITMPIDIMGWLQTTRLPNVHLTASFPQLYQWPYGEGELCFWKPNTAINQVIQPLLSDETLSEPQSNPYRIFTQPRDRNAELEPKNPDGIT